MPGPMQLHPTFPILALGLILSGGAALAQSAIGSVDLNFDGQDIALQTVQADYDGETMATAQIMSVPGVNMTIISIQGTGAGDFSIEAVYMTDEPGLADVPISVDLSWFPSGMTPPYWILAEEGEQPQFAFNTLDVGPDGGQAEGSFSGRLCRVDDLFMDPDSSDCRPFSGSFATRLFVFEY